MFAWDNLFTSYGGGHPFRSRRPQQSSGRPLVAAPNSSLFGPSGFPFFFGPDEDEQRLGRNARRRAEEEGEGAGTTRQRKQRHLQVPQDDRSGRRTRGDQGVARTKRATHSQPASPNFQKPVQRKEREEKKKKTQWPAAETDRWKAQGAFNAAHSRPAMMKIDPSSVPRVQIGGEDYFDNDNDEEHRMQVDEDNVDGGRTLHEAATTLQSRWRGRRARAGRLLPTLRKWRDIHSRIPQIQEKWKAAFGERLRSFQELRRAEKRRGSPSDAAKQREVLENRIYWDLAAYEEDLMKLLLMLDAIETRGMEEIRDRRRYTIRRIKDIMALIDKVRKSFVPHPDSLKESGPRGLKVIGNFPLFVTAMRTLLANGGGGRGVSRA